MNPCAKCGRTGGTLYTGGCSLCIPGFPIPAKSLDEAANQDSRSSLSTSGEGE